MIQTLTCTPSNDLKRYIHYFAVREFEVAGDLLLKPMHAKHEIHMMFLINSKMHDFRNNDTNVNKYTVNRNSGPDCVFSGLLTSMKGSVVFKGRVKLLTIHFKPTGFFRLFGISPVEITDCLGNCDIISNNVTRLHDQLQETVAPIEIFRLTDRFFSEKLNASKPMPECFSVKASNFLFNHPGAYSIEQLAYHSNMSLKTFERKFKQQVGLSPKIFQRICRFNSALDLKMNNVNLNWTDISHLTGYYDQMHFIKDFTVFAGVSPSAFFKSTPPLVESISTL